MTGWIRRLQAATLVLLCLHMAAYANAGTVQARSSPGPVNQRGTVTQLTPRGFILRTASHGAFRVIVTSDTSITDSGKRTHLASGDHVGVHGFKSHRTLRAIWVHIYSHAAPRPFSVSGIVRSVTASEMTIQTGKGLLRVRIGSGTSVVIGRARGQLADVRQGDRVLVRVQPGASGASALHIHVYRAAVHRRHVSLSGSVAVIAGTELTVKTADGQQRVHIPPSAVIYLGNTRTSRSALRAGERVRVYACCQGTSLSATSVHIYRTHPHLVSEILHGTVQRLLSDRIVISVGGRLVTVMTPKGTVYQIASGPARRGDFRVGDEVSVRAHLVGGRHIAARIDVLAASRTPRTISGTVTAVLPVIIITARGRLYRLDLSDARSITLGGKRVSPGALRVGDRVRARGILRAGTLATTSVSAIRPHTLQKTIRGTVVSVHGRSFVIVDATGARHVVEIVRGARPTAHGSPIPAKAIFPGVHASARGTMKGATLLASSVEVSVEAREINGRLVGMARATLQVKAAGRVVAIDLGGAPEILDAGRRLAAAALQIGAFLEVKGYAPASFHLRATSIRVLHPALDITGTLVTDVKGRSVRTSAGAIFRIHISHSTQVSNARAPVTLTMEDVPSGTRLHVTGTARSDGSIAVAAIVVQLSSVTLRGKITAVSANGIAVSSGTNTQSVRLDASTSIWQGAQSLQPTDLVVGDDVTVQGYAARDAILARTLQVHRPLVGLDGIVQATGSGGITLSAATSTVYVVVGPDTQVSGSIAIGSNVHVTGYRRGDGVILATRIRGGK